MSSTKSFPPEAFRRHSFVRLDRSAAGVADDPEVKRWVADGRPFVVRRPCVSPDAGVVFLGLSLPPSPEKRRIALEVPFASVAEVADPPLLPSIDREEVAALGASASVAGCALRTFGSHAWQSLTGLAYVTSASDLDLLMDVPSASCWEALQRTLPSSLPPGIDLEIVLGRDAAFSWREFGGPNPKLLFKGNSRVWLGSKNDVHQHFSH